MANDRRSPRPADDQFAGIIDSSYWDSPQAVMTGDDSKQYYVFTDSTGQEYRFGKDAYDVGMIADAKKIAVEERQKGQKEGLTAEQIEGNIVAAVTTRYHERYPGYDKFMSKNYDERSALETQVQKFLHIISDPTASEKDKAAATESLAAKTAELKVVENKGMDYYYSRDGKDDGIRELDNYAPGTFVCAENSVMLQLALQRSGVKTKLVTGFTDNGNNGPSASHHMFLVSNEHGNVIDAIASGREAYLKNLNGADICNADIITGSSTFTVFSSASGLKSKEVHAALKEGHERAVVEMEEFAKTHEAPGKNFGKEAMLSSKNLESVCNEYGQRNRMEQKGISPAVMNIVQRSGGIELA